MGRPKLDARSVSLGIYLPDGLLARWRAVARQEDRPVSYVLRRALTESIDAAERRVRRPAPAAEAPPEGQ